MTNCPDTLADSAVRRRAFVFFIFSSENDGMLLAFICTLWKVLFISLAWVVSDVISSASDYEEDCFL